MRDRIRHDSPRPSWRTRLHFAWVAAWGLLLTAVLSPGLVLHSALRPSDRTFKRWMTPWARLLLGLAGCRMEVRQAAALRPAQPYVFVSNHQSSLDIITASAGVPHPFGFAAKAELRPVPFVGWVLKRTACMFVDKSSARRAAEALVEAAAQLRAGQSVMLYVEGARSWARELRPFQRGAFVLALHARVPLVPVAVVGNAGVLDERAMASRPGTVRLVIGEPIPTAGLDRDAAPLLMERVRAWMECQLATDGSAVGSGR